MEIDSLSKYNIIKTSKFHSRTEEPVYLIDIVCDDFPGYWNTTWKVVNEEPLTYSEARALLKLLTGAA